MSFSIKPVSTLIRTAKLWISAAALQEKINKHVKHDKAALDSSLTLYLALIRCLWMVSSGTVASPISVTLIQAEKQNKKRLPRVRHPWPPRDENPSEEDNESLSSTSRGLLTRGIPAQPGTQPRPSPLPPALGPHELRGKAARTQTCTRALGSGPTRVGEGGEAGEGPGRPQVRGQWLSRVTHFKKGNYEGRDLGHTPLLGRLGKAAALTRRRRSYRGTKGRRGLAIRGDLSSHLVTRYKSTQKPTLTNVRVGHDCSHIRCLPGFIWCLCDTMATVGDQ